MRQPDHGALLTAVADALTACEAAGLSVKLKHGVVVTSGGYVLPAEGEWVARTLIWAPFPGEGE
jgi:hypothetical protein